MNFSFINQDSVNRLNNQSDESTHTRGIRGFSYLSDDDLGDDEYYESFGYTNLAISEGNSPSPIEVAKDEWIGHRYNLFEKY